MYKNILMLFDIENTNIEYVKKIVMFSNSIEAGLSIISIHEFDNLLPDECPVDIFNPLSEQNLISQAKFMIDEIADNDWFVKSFFISRGNYINNLLKIITSNNVDLIVVNKKGGVLFERKIKSILSKMSIDILRA